MSKTKNVVIDDQNANRDETKKRVLDLYRLSIGTIKKLSSALSDATKEVQGERTMSEAVTDCPLYGEMLPMELSIGNMLLFRAKHIDKYRKMEWMELLKELYLRMQNFYKYGYVDNGNLPGIAWSIDKNGVFCLTLRDCMVNMEYDVKDENFPDDEPCRLFAIGLNMPLLEREDPEDPESHLAGEYDEFVTFTCEFDELGEYRDVYPSHYTFTEAMRNILGSLDILSAREDV